MKIKFAVIVALLAAPAYGQTTKYSNRDPLSGVRAEQAVYVEKTTAKSLTVLPQSIIDGQYKHVPLKYDVGRRYDTPALPTYDAAWPLSAALRLPERVSYEPQYFGSFIPLTPDGPLVNSAFLPYYPPTSRPPTVSVPTPWPSMPLPSLLQPMRRAGTGGIRRK